VKASPITAHSDSFGILQQLLESYSVPATLTKEVIDRHIPVNFEKGVMVFGEGSANDLIACILSGYVKVYCPVADGSRTLMRLATPGEVNARWLSSAAIT
jgi:CRP-like cAMP-binding protein